MEIIYTINAKEDRAYWEKQNPKMLARIDRLIADIQEHPFDGIGKPEPLKFQYSGYWSRRIDSKNRLIYKINAKTIYIVQCRYHYDD